MSYADYGSLQITCPYCESADLKRLIDRIRFLKSEDARMDDLDSMFSSPDALEGLEDDPQAMGRMIRKMSAEMGEDLGEEFEEVVDRLEKGQSPEEIEAAMPDMADEMGGGGDMEDF
jgi:hypothetical protein